MKIVRRITISLAFATIAFCLLRSVVFTAAHIDYATEAVRHQFRMADRWMLPLAVAVLIILSGKNPKRMALRAVLGVCLAGGMLVLVFYQQIISGFCGVGYSSALYHHRTAPKEIAYRTFDCGATDSDPSRKLVVIRHWGPYFIHYRFIQEDHISPADWIPVPEQD